MKGKARRATPENGPVVVGTGLVALDVVYPDTAGDQPRVWAGGTCGNVLTILSYLGWNSYPIARLGNDSASKLIIQDLKEWGVKLDFARLEPQSSAPVIIQRITRLASGLPSHRFSWHCPKCGSWLPGYKAVLGKAIEGIIPNLGRPAVIFIDRLSRGSLILAKECSERGALVFFEPSGIGEPELFKEALSLAHIFKYAHDRLGEARFARPDNGPLLEIETLGATGLRYKSRLNGRRKNDWREVSSYPVKVLKDAAGSGDWCSAGILHTLGRRGLKGLSAANSVTIEHALRYGQALAAWNCGFEGARGGMYQVSKEAFEKQVSMILKKSEQTVSELERPSPTLQQLLDSLCPECEGSTKTTKSKHFGHGGKAVTN